ncbi:MAG: sel1 repeat family protein [Desulfobulbaceae bacterium]|jgi:TPR repeat protein|nr:sel1 repeat family protein [Desulfobulbaceae bacterium]
MSEEQTQRKAPIANKNPRQVFSRALVAAEQGNAEAMLVVGELYARGVGVTKNFTKALAWYEKSAEAGNGEAAFRVGFSYEIGMGAVVDMKNAVVAYNQAVRLGSARGLHKMAMLRLTGGGGVEKDRSAGLTMLQEAARSGDSAAYNSIAMIFLHGAFGQKADKEKAMKSFSLSARVGNLEGMKNLALLLADNKQFAEALRWALTARHGGLGAPELIGIINELRGKVDAATLKKVEEEARAWIRAYAAERGQARRETQQDADKT